MPGPLNGFAPAAKAREIRPELKVLFASGFATGAKASSGKIAAPIIQKPWHPAELRATIAAALQ